jgi:molybdate transport system substrate-binding protein
MDDATKPSALALLCAGAAQGLVKALQPAFEAATGARLEARFGAVGAMKEALLGGAPCDVMVVTAAMVAQLVASGELRAGSVAALGRVRTGIAVRAGDPSPAIDTPEALRAALLAADRIHFPDAVRSTAGIHFASVLQRLGIADAVADRIRTFPNGATAMRELASSDAARPIGCTQVSEILYTPGLNLVGVLPTAFELATVYSAAVARDAADAELARRFVALLAGMDSASARRAGGFEIDAAPDR